MSYAFNEVAEEALLEAGANAAAEAKSEARIVAAVFMVGSFTVGESLVWCGV